MCSNYEPSDEEQLAAFLEDIGQAPQGQLFGPYPSESWPGYLAPFVRQDPDSAEHRPQVCLGVYGLVPHWSKDLTISRRTYNASSETVAEKPSFRDAWKRGRRCIIPAKSIYEPSYEQPGSPVRWRIKRADGRPLGIAGLWESWKAPDGKELLSFTMLTVNADRHPVMQRFHRSEDEKRMVVILDDTDYNCWLDCPHERMSDFLVRYPADLLITEAFPLPPRRRSASTKSAQSSTGSVVDREASADTEQGGLF